MEEKKDVKKQNHTHIDLVILLVLLVILSGLLFVFVSRKKTTSVVPTTNNVSPSETGTQTQQTNPTSVPKVPTLTPTPSPKPIPHGKTSFFVSVGSNVKGPRMGKGTIDPYDPTVNGPQTLTIEVADTVPIEKVVAIIKTDHKTSEEHALEPVAGTKNWSGTWNIDDSYLYTYELTIRATSASGTSSVDVTLR